jgi:hypothetical protein
MQKESKVVAEEPRRERGSLAYWDLTSAVVPWKEMSAILSRLW